jgi:uncharacterized protein
LRPERYALHRAARHWFSNLQDEKLVFCRLTQLGFLRLLTNKHVIQEEVMSPDEAWRAYRALRLDRRIGYLAEPNELPETWQAFTKGRLSSPNLWTDAYLCAFANAGRLTLVTFDAKIPTREGVNCLVLSS